MRHDRHLVSSSWDSYELLDSGDSLKLERFGEIIVARPETQALWEKRQSHAWEKANATFSFIDKKGSWEKRSVLPESWELSWGAARFLARLAGFKHTGVFPEQAPNWEWIRTAVGKKKEPDILNLFGYTGIASVVAALAGGFVTHVDASKQSLDWARENARLSNVPENAIRWMHDDAIAFVKREARRKARYDGVILDPPAFGRGAKGEVWKIEKGLPTLLEALAPLLKEERGSFFLMSGYAAGYAPRSFAQAVEDIFGDVESGESGELHIKEARSERVIPAGIYVRFMR